MLLSNEQIEANKKEFIELLRSTQREGIENLISWLSEKSDFFTAPSSRQFHSNFVGGLCYHSLNVYKVAKKIKEGILPMSNKTHKGAEFTDNELIIACLLHDLCKTHFYKQELKWFKDESAAPGQQWKQYCGWTIEDQFPLGHGEKSMFMAQRFIILTGNEAMGIRFHMHFFSPVSQLDYIEKQSFSQAVEKYDIVATVAMADAMSSFVLEPTEDLKTGLEA